MAGNLRFSNPNTLAKPPGYSYVVEATGPNRLIYLAGQLGLDMDNQFGRWARRFPRAVLAGVREHDAGARVRRCRVARRGQDQQLPGRYSGHMAAFREVRDHFLNKARRRHRRPSACRRWRGRAGCSRSRRSRCCRQRRQSPQRRGQTQGSREQASVTAFALAVGACATVHNLPPSWRGRQRRAAGQSGLSGVSEGDWA